VGVELIWVVRLGMCPCGPNCLGNTFVPQHTPRAA
jgi:hypothetical protein